MINPAYAVPAVLLSAALTGCGGSETSTPAPTASSAPAATTAPAAAPTEVSAPPVAAPAAKGPWKAGDPIPKLDRAKADIQPPKEIGDRRLVEGIKSVFMYQGTNGGPIATIAPEDQKVDFYLTKGKNPVAYDRFVCTEGLPWGGGIKCYVKLTDGTLSFQAEAGEANTIQKSAAFASQALAVMNLQPRA